MWRSFWANPGSTAARDLSVEARINLLSRAVGPVFQYRCSRWPPQKTLSLEVDTVQHKMAASILRVQQMPTEDPGEYCRRRNRNASALCRRMGLWSATWFKRAVAWDGHLRRMRNISSWGAALVMYRGKKWLQERRVSFLGHASRGGSSLASKTGTRSIQGPPCIRWHDGIDFAKRVVL